MRLLMTPLLLMLVIATTVSAQYKGALNCYFPSIWKSFEKDIQYGWKQIQTM